MADKLFDDRELKKLKDEEKSGLKAKNKPTSSLFGFAVFGLLAFFLIGVVSMICVSTLQKNPTPISTSQETGEQANPGGTTSEPNDNTGVVTVGIIVMLVGALLAGGYAFTVHNTHNEHFERDFNNWLDSQNPPES